MGFYLFCASFLVDYAQRGESLCVISSQEDWDRSFDY